MISIEIKPTPETVRLMKNLEGSRELLRHNLRMSMRKSLRDIVCKTRQRLVGPRPSRLDIVTKRLYNSIGFVVGRWEGDTLAGRVGSDVRHRKFVPYAAVHEFGYSNPAQRVKAHQRMQTHIFGVPVTPFLVNVTNYTRKMNIPRRAYVAPAIEKVTPSFRHLIERSVVNALNGKVMQ